MTEREDLLDFYFSMRPRITRCRRLSPNNKHDLLLFIRPEDTIKNLEKKQFVCFARLVYFM